MANKYLGKVDGFYLNQPILSELMRYGGLETGGDKVVPPSYLLDSSLDFPYHPINNGKPEVMFTKGATLVRFLGGVGATRIHRDSEAGDYLDVVKRDSNGKLVFTPDHIARYDDHIKVFGTNVTVVLDNIPYCLVKNSHIDDYGNSQCPDDLQEFFWTVSKLLDYLIDRYGMEIVGQWRWRLSTEGRIKTDSQTYAYIYENVYNIISKRCPDAKFGIFNAAAIENMANQDVNVYEVAKILADRKIPVDFLPVSCYSIQRINENGNIIPISSSPSLRPKTAYVEYFDKVSEILGYRPSIEVQELGVLHDEYGVVNNEPGPRGAAWWVQLIESMREFNGMSKLWHWHVTDVLKLDKEDYQDNLRLLRSIGWLFNIFDKLDGGSMYSLDVKAVGAQNPSIEWGGMRIETEDANYLLVSGYNLDKNVQFNGFCKVLLEGMDMEEGQYQCLYLNQDNDVYKVIKEDLVANKFPSGHIDGGIKATLPSEDIKFRSRIGHLNMPPLDYSLSTFFDSRLTNLEGEKFIAKNFSKYTKIIQDSLKYSSIQVYKADNDNNQNFIAFKSYAPQVTLIKVPKK